MLTRFLERRSSLVILYLVFLAAYVGASGPRLRRHSAYNHFVYLAHGWLHGHLSMDAPPPNENDWARVEVLTLKDGRTLKGMWSKTGATDRFAPLRGRSLTVVDEDIASRSSIRYVSFPPFPAVLMTPFVAVAGLDFNDVAFTVALAALNPVLFFLLLGFLRKRGHSSRTPVEDLWLTLFLGVGSVCYFASVLGQVWYTAHVVGVGLTIGYAWAGLDARRPAWAGLFLGLGFATRTPMGFMFPLFLVELVRTTGGVPALRAALRRWRLPPDFLRKLLAFAAPAAGVLAILLVHNYLRFERFTEFGHKYLNILWQDRIQRFGLFNYHFLSRNLSAMLVLLPRILTSYPFVKVSVHGMSIFATSPNLVYLARPPHKSPLAPALWLTVLFTAIPALLYQNSGYLQFGYRFILDYLVFLVVLLAVGGRRLTWLWKVLLIAAIGVNLFGAIVFDRLNVFTYDDSFFPNGNN